MIEIKSSKGLVKISTKRTKNKKLVYLNEGSLPNLSLYMPINVMLIKKAVTSSSFVALPRLHATAVHCAHELINRESGINGEAGKILQN